MADAGGAVLGVWCWFFGAWGVFVPPVLALLTLVRAITARRAVVLTAIYILIALAITAPWSYYVNRARPLAIFAPLDVWLQFALTETIVLVLACMRWPTRNDLPWQWGARVTRTVLLCTGVLGLLLVTPGILGQGTVFGGRTLYQGISSLQAAYFALQFYCALVIVRHGIVQRRWLWLATSGALLIRVLSWIVGLILEGDWLLHNSDFWQNWFTFEARLGSLAAANAALLWYWWPALFGGMHPPLTDAPLCPACGYNLIGNVSGRCPECGTAVAVYLSPQG